MVAGEEREAALKEFYEKWKDEVCYCHDYHYYTNKYVFFQSNCTCRICRLAAFIPDMQGRHVIACVRALTYIQKDVH